MSTEAIRHPLTLTLGPTGEHFAFTRSARGSGDGRFHFTWTLAPGKRGPGAHYHEAETETFTVTRGVLRIWLDGVPRDLAPGENVAVPPRTPHCFLNPGTEPAIVEVTLDGTRMEDQFIPLAIAVQRGMSTPRMFAKMMVHIADLGASTPTSRFERAMFSGVAAALRALGVRGFATVNAWEPVVVQGQG